MGTKYIIEVEDKPFELINKDGLTSEKLFRAKGFNSLVFDWNGLQMLTPYTEPDTEQVRKEFYQRGYSAGKVDAYDEDAKKITKLIKKSEEAYQKGLDDAWECARKIGDIPYGEQEKVFGSRIWPFIATHTAQEAIERIRQYEQKKEELEESKKEKPIRVEDVMRQYLDTFCSKCSACGSCILNTSDFKCGRGYHFLTNNRVSDEEVRRAYATVIKKR